MKAFKKIIDWFMFLMGANGEIHKQAEKDGICDFNGQK